MPLGAVELVPRPRNIHRRAVHGAARVLDGKNCFSASRFSAASFSMNNSPPAKSPMATIVDGPELCASVCNSHAKSTFKQIEVKASGGAPVIAASWVNPTSNCSRASLSRVVAAEMPYPPALLFTIPNVRLFTGALLTLGRALRGSDAVFTYCRSASI